MSATASPHPRPEKAELNPPVTSPSQAPARKKGKWGEYRGPIVLIVGIAFLYTISPFWKPLALAGVFAISLYPLYERWRTRRIGPRLKAFLLTTLFSVLFLAPLAAVFYRGADAALTKLQSLQSAPPPATEEGSHQLIHFLGLEPFIDKILDFLPLEPTQIGALVDQTEAALKNHSIGLLQGLLSDLPMAIFAMAIMIVAIYYLLIDGPKMVNFFRENSFFGRKNTEKIINVTQSMCHSVIVATIMAGLVQAAVIATGALVTGAANAFAIMLIAFVLSFIPVVGTAPVTLWFTLNFFSQGEPLKAFGFMAFGVVAGISDNFVRPYFIKGGARLHPLIAFVSVFGALEVMGIAGLFLGPIIAGVFLHMLPLFLNSKSGD